MVYSPMQSNETYPIRRTVWNRHGVAVGSVRQEDPTRAWTIHNIDGDAIRPGGYGSGSMEEAIGAMDAWARREGIDEDDGVPTEEPYGERGWGD